MGEPGAKQVKAFLEKIQTNDYQGYINIINLTEVYYAIARRELKAAESMIKFLYVFKVNVVPVEENGLWREAALIKNKYMLSLGDSFAVATALATKSKLVIGGDKELNDLDIPLIRIRK